MKKLYQSLFLSLISLASYGQAVPDWKLGTSMNLMQTDLKETFIAVKNAGIDYLEVGMPKFSKVNVADIIFQVAKYKECADETGLKIWSIHIPYGWDFDISTPDPIIREQCKQYVLFTLEIAKGLGKYEKAILHPSFEPINKEERIGHIAAFRECLKELGPLVEKDYNVRIAVENLPRTCLANSAAETITLVDGIISVDICFDVNHLLGEKSEYFAEKLGKMIKTVHISDYDEENERHWLPGEGVINWNAVVDGLVKGGYDGPFMFEVTKTPWEGDMKKFSKDLVASWKKIQKDYKVYLKKQNQ
ncbi:MAG: sugar phosphate isomerase/epimerase [Tannerellaceae bacterium]|nr:sugar phosphate isomerase/epimerase [Tannerellaceae bacterium]